MYKKRRTGNKEREGKAKGKVFFFSPAAVNLKRQRKLLNNSFIPLSLEQIQWKCAFHQTTCPECFPFISDTLYLHICFVLLRISHVSAKNLCEFDELEQDSNLIQHNKVILSHLFLSSFL